MNWTKEQLEAIETREKNMLVSAAAGSGKTALLIERIVRIIIEEKLNVDEFLILTFTRAAAGEMKKRLSLALTQALDNPKNDRNFIMKQLNGLGSAMITTLHSFCLSILRQYFQQVGVDPGFSLGNEIEMTLMRKEVLEDVFEKEYQKAQSDETTGFPQLIEKYSGNKNDQGLKESVEKSYYFLTTLANPEEWCEKAIKAFACTKTDFWESLWGKELKEILETELQGALDFLEKGVNRCENVEGFEKTFQQILGDQKLIENIKERIRVHPNEGLTELGKVVFSRYSGNNKIDKELSESIKENRNEGKKIIVNLQKCYAQRMDDMIDELNDLEKTMEDFVNLTLAFRVAFIKKKNEKNLVDFNDLERYTLKILEDDLIANDLREKYVHIFLDEYQDTNEIQESIIQRIARKNNYFMVGDVKQSIYRFRSADPTIFIEKYYQFREKEDKENRLVNLNRNFRSAQGIINGINQIFMKIMSTNLGEVEYDSDAMLYKGLPQNGPYEKIEIHLLNRSEDLGIEGEEENPLKQLTDVEREARFVGERIQGLVGTEIFDTRKNEKRVITYRDFGVLMRSVSERGDIYQKVFTKMGIPSYFDGGSNYFESLEIKVMINFLSLIDNQHQDLPLLTVMTSPIGGFGVEECSQIRIENPLGFYYHAVEIHRDSKTDALAIKLRKFYNRLRLWREASKILEIEDFLWKLYLESGYYAFVGSLPGGEQRQNNLRALLKKAGDYKKSTLRGLFQFIRFIENIKKYKQDTSPPAVLSQGDNVVRMMTIHKSKGLEFPIVFLTGTGKKFNKQFNREQILFHKDLGICPNYVNLEERYKRDSLAKEVCKAKSNVEMLSEEMRLLYVAMTRAEEKLVIVGTTNKEERDKKKWLETPDKFKLLKSSRSIDWILFGVLGGEKFTEIPETLELEHFILYEHSGGEASVSEERERLEIDIENPWEINPQVKEEVFRRLNFEPPKKIENDFPNKMSVTEIKNFKLGKNLGFQETKMTEKPKFLTKTTHEFSSAQRGSGLHLIMESIKLEPLKKWVLENKEKGLKEFLNVYVQEECKRLIAEEFLEKSLGKLIDLEKIVDFYSSDLGIRLLSSPDIKREIPFNYNINPQEIREEWGGTKEKIMVQGIIDCGFLESGEWVMIDYKTDYYQNTFERENLIEKYRVQLDLYAEALEVLTNTKVKEKRLALITMKENVLLN
ncbi:MAG: helicase-exonuclease AddAB subunit AddA [Eubacteriaceae bacterium]